MGHSYTIFIGTVGNGLQYSRDGGESWDNAKTGEAPPNSTVAGLEGNVRALGVYPNDPNRILAGTDWTGIYRSDDNGESWNHIKSPMEGMEIWSIDVDPTDPDKIYVGTRPQGFRSSDGGESWEKMEIGVDESAPLWPPRTTKITVDPRDNRTIWAGVEVDGVHKSLDGGDSWLRLPDVGPSQFYGDIHCMAINAQDSRVYATSPFGIATSLDEGESWDVHQFPGIREGEAALLLPRRDHQAGRPRHDVRRQRQRHPRRGRSHQAHQGRRRDVGRGISARRTQLRRVLARHSPRCPRHGSRREHLRLRVPQ